MHAEALPSRSLLVLALALLVLLPVALPAAGPPAIGEPDPRVVDPRLRQVLASADPDRAMDILVTFDVDVTEEDRELLEELGVEYVGEYHFIPVVHARARPAQVDRLSGYQRARWIELDEPLEYLMDMTTAVVNATNTWNSLIEGNLWPLGGVDGSGVTAVVLDTGIDAGHPDLDYGRKTIRNLKSDTGTGPWYEIENGDTSSGHGTHCAGTVAGNGDASAGQKRGVAPGANLIGLSTGEAGAITGAVGALQWVYDHSTPGNNPYNIRVVSNSWGAGGGQYDPGDAISQAINRLTYENNVVCVFAAGNSGGTGEDIQAGNYANTPAAICVAASGRDGSYITSFSSKGQWNWVDTWPDVAAPGHHIDSTAARRTQISAMTQQGDSNPYYLSISGTSMATPHVSGLVALLWQAAPSMRVSDVPQDVGLVEVVDGEYQVTAPEEGTYGNLAYPIDTWMLEAPDTRIHEAELIIKLTADMIPTGAEPDPDMNNQTDNYVPDWSVPGFAADRPHDFCQGYGLMNARRAVGLALTLERLRYDHPEATVLDAYTVFESIFETKEVVKETDRLTTSWSGEWSRFNEQPTSPNLVFGANQTKYVYVPEGAEEARVSLVWPPIDTTKVIGGTMGFRIDFDGDGTWDHSSSILPSLDGTRTETVSASGHDGSYWRFGIEGHFLKWHRLVARKQFQEVRVEYDISLSITFGQGVGTIVVPPLNPHAIVADLRHAEPTADYTVGNISMVKHVFNINNVSWSPLPDEPEVPETQGFNWWWLLVLLVALVVVAYFIARQWPHSRVGILIRRVAVAVGAVWVLDRLRVLVRMPARLPSGSRPKGGAEGGGGGAEEADDGEEKAPEGVVTAELVSEEGPPAETS